MERAELNLRSAKGFFDVGTRPKSDVARAEVDVANARVDLIRARNALRQAIVALNIAMAIDVDAPTQSVDNLIYQPVTIDRQRLRADSLRQRPEYRQSSCARPQPRRWSGRPSVISFPMSPGPVPRQFADPAQRGVVRSAWPELEPLRRRQPDRALPRAKSNVEGREGAGQVDRASTSSERLSRLRDRRRGSSGADSGGSDLGGVGPGEFPAGQGRFDAGVRRSLELTHDAQLTPHGGRTPKKPGPGRLPDRAREAGSCQSVALDREETVRRPDV